MDSPCTAATEANAYINAFNDRASEQLLRFFLDIVQSQLSSRDISAFMLEMGENLFCFHIHDNDGCENQRLFPYIGIIDWNCFCSAVRGCGFRGDMSFEILNSLN